VDRVLAAIRAGDCYQANLSRRLVVDAAGSALECAFRLRRSHPAQYGALLDLGDAGQVVSNSPELLLRVENGRVETRPVKGTRPRGTSAALDRVLARQLMLDSKEQAELTMIVDMARNDLSRVCTPGSVVTSQRALKTLPTLFHAEQSVQGQLAAGQDAVSALEATFPGASITGAPKVAAMEIIHALEPVPRGVYTGSIGFFGDGGTAQWNVAIRTTTFTASGSAHVQVGAGIVADSKPRMELDETDWKARAWLAALLEPQTQALEVHP
jgi:para-aminobenzoate synthetase component 1